MSFRIQGNQVWRYVFPNQKQKAEHAFLSLSPLSLIISNDRLFYWL